MTRVALVGTMAGLLLACIAMAGVTGSDTVSKVNSPGTSLSESHPPIGTIFIESPKRGRLMRLQGIVGRGELIASQPDGTCVSVAIRIASGNVNGHGMGISRAESIHLVIHSRAITERLLAGEEVFSQHHRVGIRDADPTSDIHIASGLGITDEFVLNPGEWSWTSLFGLAKTEVACERLLST